MFIIIVGASNTVSILGVMKEFSYSPVLGGTWAQVYVNSCHWFCFNVEDFPLGLIIVESLNHYGI